MKIISKSFITFLLSILFHSDVWCELSQVFLLCGPRIHLCKALCCIIKEKEYKKIFCWVFGIINTLLKTEFCKHIITFIKHFKGPLGLVFNNSIPGTFFWIIWHQSLDVGRKMQIWSSKNWKSSEFELIFKLNRLWTSRLFYATCQTLNQISQNLNCHSTYSLSLEWWYIWNNKWKTNDF